MENNAPPPPPPASVPSVTNPLPQQESISLIQTKSNSRKKILLLLPAVLFIVAAILGAIFLLPKSQTQSNPGESPTPQKSKKIDEMSEFTGGVPITPNTVQVTKADGKYCLRYKNHIYLPQQQGEYDPKEVFPQDPEIYQWYGLIDAPSDLSTDTPFKDEVFGFKTFLDNSGFMFIMRWPKEKNDHYEVFNFKNNAVNPIASFTPTIRELVYRVPKIYQMSPGGNLVALHMFDCWECEKHYPQTFLLNLLTRQTKAIGQTSYFSWKEDGQYEYKDYFVNQDPSTLPLKNDSFNF